jgi:hypothetical protein
VTADQLHHQKQDEEDEHRILYAQYRTGPENAGLARDAGDPGPSGDEQDHAPQRVEHPERHDDGRDAPDGHEQAVDRPGQRANGYAGK